MKVCTGCGQEKPESEFSKSKAGRNGLQSKCKACYAAYYQANKGHIGKNVQQWQKANRDRTAVHRKRWRHANPKRITEYRRGWRQRHPDLVVQHSLAYAERNPSKAYRLMDPEYCRWRLRVYERDNYTCQQCFRRGSITLNAHHVKPWAQYTDLRFVVENGITLCVPCHEEEHRKMKEQSSEY